MKPNPRELSQVIAIIGQQKVKLRHKGILYSTRYEFEDLPNQDRFRYSIIPTMLVEDSWQDVPNGQELLESIIVSDDFELVEIP